MDKILERWTSDTNKCPECGSQVRYNKDNVECPSCKRKWWAYKVKVKGCTP